MVEACSVGYEARADVRSFKSAIDSGICAETTEVVCMKWHMMDSTVLQAELA